jgi:hypothetical protein
MDRFAALAMTAREKALRPQPSRRVAPPLPRSQCEASAVGVSSGRTSAAMQPFEPWP